jgi:hypothetical protein
MQNGNTPLLSVRNLKTYFFQDEGKTMKTMEKPWKNHGRKNHGEKP